MGFFLPLRCRAALGLTLLLLPLSLLAARTDDSPALSKPFRAAIDRGLETGAYRRLAVGVIDGDRRDTFYFAAPGAASSKPDDRSQFEIGAISEVFTGVLLAQAAVEGKLRFTDPIAKWLPPSFPFTDARTGTITLQQLATQQSGLPIRPPNLFPLDASDPYAHYASEDLLALLAYLRGLPNDAPYRYSVLNFGLLGHLLGRIYNTPYTDLLVEKVLAPMGLRSASFADGADLLGGQARGLPAPHWHYAALAGAAGLRVSLPDLLLFLQLNLKPDSSPLRAALLLARQPRGAGPADRLALGWNVRDQIDGSATWPLVWRASRTAGFASFIGFRIDQQKAIAILADTGEDVAALGMAWLAGHAPPPTPSPARAATQDQLGAFPGLYQFGTAGEEVIVRSDNGMLSVQLAGTLPTSLHAVGPDIFAGDEGAIVVTFMRAFGEVNGLVLHVDGTNLSAARLSRRAPALARNPITIPAAERTSLIGDYRLDGATWLRISTCDSGLCLQWTLAPSRRLFAYARDRYRDADGALDIQVERTASGAVTALKLELAGAAREALPLYVLANEAHAP